MPVLSRSSLLVQVRGQPSDCRFLVQACPDHFSKRALFALLDATAATGATLTETCAMDPAASVAGWYFAHPEARYFGMGRLGRDQVADWAARTGLDEDTAADWLAANLD